MSRSNNSRRGRRRCSRCACWLCTDTSRFFDGNARRDASTREALKLSHDADALGVIVTVESWDEERGSCAWCGTHYECNDDLFAPSIAPVGLGTTLAMARRSARLGVGAG